VYVSPDGKDDLSFDAAGLAELVRLGRLLQRKDLVEDDPQEAVLVAAGSADDVRTAGLGDLYREVPAAGGSGAYGGVVRQPRAAGPQRGGFGS
jgi:hypothetical protein